MGHQLDSEVVLFLNQFVHRWWTLDTFLRLCVSSPLLRGAPTAVLIWWAWFKEGKDQRRNREILLYGLFGCVCALLLGRAVAHLLPFHPRPLHDPELVLRLADGVSRDTLRNWNSFPSDHAALLFTLATSLWLVSRSTGALAFAQVLFIVCLPRVFVGLHYPSDIIGGAIIGVFMALPALSVAVRRSVASRALQWLNDSPKHFYTAFFFATYMIGIVFDPVPDLLRFSVAVARGLVFRMHALFPAPAEHSRLVLTVAIFLVAGLLAVVTLVVWTRRRHSQTGPSVAQH